MRRRGQRLAAAGRPERLGCRQRSSAPSPDVGLSAPVRPTQRRPPSTNAGRIKYDVTNDLSMKLQTQLTKEKGYSQVMLDVDAKGQDWQARAQRARRRVRLAPARATLGRPHPRHSHRRAAFRDVYNRYYPPGPIQDWERGLLRPQLHPERHAGALDGRGGLLAGHAAQVGHRLRGQARDGQARGDSPGGDDGARLPHVCAQREREGAPRHRLPLQLELAGGAPRPPLPPSPPASSARAPLPENQPCAPPLRCGGTLPF